MAKSLGETLSDFDSRLVQIEKDYNRKIASKDLRIDSLLALISQLNDRVQTLENKCGIQTKSMEIDLLIASNNRYSNHSNYNNTQSNVYNQPNNLSYQSSSISNATSNSSNTSNIHTVRNTNYNTSPQIDWASLQDCDTDGEIEYYNNNNLSNDPINTNYEDHDNNERIANAIRDMNPLFDSTYFEVTRAKNRSGRDEMEARYMRQTAPSTSSRNNNNNRKYRIKSRGENRAGEGEDDYKHSNDTINKRESNITVERVEYNQDDAVANSSFSQSLLKYTSVACNVNEGECEEYSKGNESRSKGLIFNKPFIECGFDVQTINNFDDMGLEDNMLRGIYAYGFELPSRIQLTCIPPLMKSRNMIIQERSGTGKTAAYLIPICNKIYSTILNQSRSKQKQNQQSNTPTTNNNKRRRNQYNQNQTIHNGCQCIIIVPSRELCNQIGRVAKQLTNYFNFRLDSGIECGHIDWIELYGGKSVRADINALDVKNSLPGSSSMGVIGTYGRINDMVKRGALDLSNIQHIVVDDFDVLVQNKKFINFLDILAGYNIDKNLENNQQKLPKTSKKIQKIFVSTTMSNKAYEIAKAWINKGLSGKDINNPMMQCLEVLVSDKELLSDIGHFKFELVTLKSNRFFRMDNKFIIEKVGSVLNKEFSEREARQCLIFVNTAGECDWLVEMLKKYFKDNDKKNTNKNQNMNYNNSRSGYSNVVDVSSLMIRGIHDDMVQSERELIVKEFRSGSCRLLISTDIMACGIDIHMVNLVITKIPNTVESFVNRIGRAGRYGRSGKVVLLLDDGERNCFEQVVDIFGIPNNDWSDYQF